MWFHIPIKVYTREKKAYRSSWVKANIGIEVKSSETGGPFLIIKTSSKTTRIDVRCIYGHGDPLSLAIYGGPSYKFDLFEPYLNNENRVILVRFIAVVKFMGKGKMLTQQEVIMRLGSDSLIEKYRQSWLTLRKSVGLPRRQFYLSCVNLSNQKLEVVPRALGDILLKDVNLSKNHLGSTKEYWSWLCGPIRNSLVTLSLSDNHLKQFPSQIVMCTALTQLDVSHNDIKKLPHRLFLGPMKLAYFDIRHNVHLAFWPHPTNRLEEVNIEGCNNLSAMTLNAKKVTLPVPLSLLTQAANFILNYEKMRYEIGICPNKLIERLNWASLCYKCQRLYVNPIIQERCVGEIATKIIRGHTNAPVLKLKFHCGC